MARGVISEEFQDASGNVAAVVPIDIFEDDGVTPFAGVIYSAKTGGAPIVAPTTNSLGRFTGYVDLADVRPIKVKRTSASVASLVASNAYHDPRDLVNLSTTQTLSSKTLASPILTGTTTAADITASGALSAAGLMTLSAGNANGKAITAFSTGQGLDTMIVPGADLGMYQDEDYSRCGLHKAYGVFASSTVDLTALNYNVYGKAARVDDAKPVFNLFHITTPDNAQGTNGSDIPSTMLVTTHRTGFGTSVVGTGVPNTLGLVYPAASYATIFNTSAATANTITSDVTISEAASYVPGGAFTDGWSIYIKSGTGINQLPRRIVSQAIVGGKTQFTVSPNWSIVPDATSQFTINYGSSGEMGGITSQVFDDSSINLLGTGHTTPAFLAYARNTWGSTGNVSSNLAVITSHSRRGLAIGAEFDVGIANRTISPYWNGGAVPGSAGTLVMGSATGGVEFTNPTAVGLNTVTKTGAFVAGFHQGGNLIIVSGTGAGQTHDIASNTVDVITLTANWTAGGGVAPDATSVIRCGAMYNSAAHVVSGNGATGAWRQGLLFDTNALNSPGSTGIDFHTSSGVAFAITIPTGNALFAWKSGQTYAANYAGKSMVASHPRIPLIGTSGDITYIGTSTQMVFAENSVGNTFTTEYARIGSAGFTVSGTGRRIFADLDNGTIANRTLFQTLTTNAGTSVGVIPNGASSAAAVQVINGSTPTNAAYGSIDIDATAVYLTSTRFGTGTTLPIMFRVGNAPTEQARIAVNGDKILGTAGSSIAQAATAGFVFVQNITVSGAGTPSGVPTNYGGVIAMSYDAVNHKLWAYEPGVGWKSATFA